MIPRENQFVKLADRAEQGDKAARAQFQDSLQHHLPAIVRRALNKGRERTSMEQRIFAEARQLGLDNNPDVLKHQEDFIHQVADGVRRFMMARIPSGQPGDCFREETIMSFSDPSTLIAC